MVTVPGFGPKYAYGKNTDDDNYTVVVTPPTITQFGPSSLTLTEDQFIRFKIWLVNGGLIQEMLPDLNDDEREILLTGIGPEEWDETFGEDE